MELSDDVVMAIVVVFVPNVDYSVVQTLVLVVENNVVVVAVVVAAAVVVAVAAADLMVVALEIGSVVDYSVADVVVIVTQILCPIKKNQKK